MAGGLNVNAYADNNPITSRDPLGLFTLSVCSKIGGGFGVGAGGGTCVNFGGGRKKGFSFSVTGTVGGGGFAGIGGAAGLSMSVSNAPTVFDLNGGFFTLGAAGNIVGAGGVVGATGFVSTSNPSITGIELFGGLGLVIPGITSPFAVEGQITSTSTIIGVGQQGLVGPSQ